MDIHVTISLLVISLCYSYAADRKHVVMIVADDLGWNDVSFHGSNQFLTPNIDALAYSGIILQNYYVMSLCSPSRSALMSGIHPIHTGMYDRVLYAPTPYGLPLDIKILPQYLKDYGYKTHAVGKWHLGHFKKVYTPTERGFDSHFGYWNSHQDYYSHRLNEFFMSGRDFKRNGDDVWEYAGQYATDLFTKESVDIINSHNTSEPMFLYLAHLAVHSANPLHPLQAPHEIIDKFSYIKNKHRRIFAAMMYKLDESVGQVVRALAEKDMLKDTIIVFTTDNGGPAGGFNQNAASNWPLRGVKDTLWEGGVRGAAFIWSADLPRSTVNNALMHIQDWLPTIIGAIDESADTNSELKKLDGHNMWPVIKGEKEYEYNEIIIQRDDIRKISALRKDQWKLIQGNSYKGKYDKWYGPSGRDDIYTYNMEEIKQSPVATILQNNFTFPSDDEIIKLRGGITLNCDYCGDNATNCKPCHPNTTSCLFDIASDPCELNNVADLYPEVAAELKQRIEYYVPVPALNKPLDARADPIFWNSTWTNWMDYVDDDYNNTIVDSIFQVVSYEWNKLVKLF